MEVFSPTSPIRSVRLLIAFALIYGLELTKADVVQAILMAPLNDDSTYVTFPAELDEIITKVCRELGIDLDRKPSQMAFKLKAALYGLRQSSFLWNETLTKALLEAGWKQSKLEPTLFYLTGRDNKTIGLLSTFVDDLLIASHPKVRIKLIQALKSKFKLKMEVSPDEYLGICIHYHPDGSLSMDHSDYIMQVAQRFRQVNGRSTSTPYDTNVIDTDLTANTKPCDKRLYQQLIGCLMYIARLTRPSICWVVTRLSQHNTNPTTKAYNQGLKCLRYLVSTRHEGIVFSPHVSKSTRRLRSDSLVAFSDAPLNVTLSNPRVIGGYAFYWQGFLIDYSAKTSPWVALSTVESELNQLVTTAKHGCYLSKLYHELRLLPSPRFDLVTDAQGALKQIQSKQSTDGNRHYLHRVVWIRDMYQRERRFDLSYISTHDMLADIFTKALPAVTLERLRVRLTMDPITSLSTILGES